MTSTRPPIGAELRAAHDLLADELHGFDPGHADQAAVRRLFATATATLRIAEQVIAGTTANTRSPAMCGRFDALLVDLLRLQRERGGLHGW